MENLLLIFDVDTYINKYLKASGHINKSYYIELEEKVKIKIKYNKNV